MQKQTRAKKFLVLLLANLVTLSCASYTDSQRALRDLYRQGAYNEALEQLEQSPLKNSSKNRLLYLLEKASILDRTNQKKKSRKLFIEADRVIDELYTTSVLKTAASFVYNDSTTDYEGELFERITIHSLLALSFIEDGQLKDARVEAKRINNRLYEFTKELGPTNNSYQKDAFALYLSAMIYEALGEYDDALIDYKKALQVYESSDYQKFYFGNIRSQIAKPLYKLALLRRRKDLAQKLAKKYPEVKQENQQETGELIVLHDAGSISLKESKDFFLPIGKQVVRFSYPIVAVTGPNFYQTGLITGDKKFTRAQNASYLSAIAHQTLEDKRLRLVAKGLARILLKAQINKSVEENFGPIAGILSNIVTASTETADTRCWMFLPDGFFVTRVELPAGEHKIKTVNNGFKAEEQTVTIQKNKIVLLRAPRNKQYQPQTNKETSP